MKHPNQTGQSAVLIALMLVGFVAFLGLVIDGGRAYGVRRQSQNASDSAAFAGTRVLAYHNSNTTCPGIWNAITNYAARNGVTDSNDVTANFLNASGGQTGTTINSTCLVPTDATGVLVTTTIRFQPFLIGVVVGNGSLAASTRAAVQSGPPTAESNLMPMTIFMTGTIGTWDAGTTRMFGVNTGPGSFSWVSYDCNPTLPDLSGYLDPNPATRTLVPVVHIGDWICPGTGQEVGSPIRNELDIWLAMAASQRTWTIPIYDQVMGSGNTLRYRVAGFAELIFTAYSLNGPQGSRYLEGTFVRYVDSPSISYSGPCNTIQNTSFCSLSLVR
jgi:Flp pilus assembly protein TadG